MGWKDAPDVDVKSTPAKWESAPDVSPNPSKKEGAFIEGAGKVASDYIKGIPSKALEGAVRGGPLGAVTNVYGSGMSALNKISEDASYRTGGAVSEGMTKLGASPEVSGGAGYAANVGMQAIPVIAGGGIAKGAAPIMEAGAQRLMKSAVKPSGESWLSGKAQDAIDTMLKEGISASKGGIEKLEKKVSSLNDAIKEAISSSSATVDKSKVADTLEEVYKYFQKGGLPEKDLEIINGAKDEFLRHPLLPGKSGEKIINTGVLDASGKPITKTIPASGSDQFPVQLAQEMKQRIYQLLEKKYKNKEVGTALDESEKALARGLKEGVAEAVPAVRPLNAEESKLLNVLNVSERRILMEANKNPMGLSLIAENPAAWAGFLADRSALFKSLVARMMHSGQEQIPATAARIGIGGYEAATSGKSKNKRELTGETLGGM